MADADPCVAFVGLGSMGKGMACCLARYLKANGRQPLRLYNRDPSKLTPLLEDAELGCVQAASLADVATSAQIIFMMLSHDTAVRDVVGQLVAALQAGAGAAGQQEQGLQQQVPQEQQQEPQELLEQPQQEQPQQERRQRIIVDCSTVSPETTADLSRAAQAVGAAYVACPVLGRPDAAAAANLLIFCSGPDAAKQALVPYLGAMGRKVLDLGSEPQKAHIMKLLANFHLVSLIELLSEGMTLAEKNGISRDTYMSFVDEILPVPIVHGYGARMAADAFDAGAGFTVTLGLKDVNLMRKLAESSETPLPLADVAFNHLLSAKAAGLADKDWAALAVAVRKSAGMPE
ncbi:putative oxidoreductase YfjR [Tetrabaena socialis]|uniref:Putative oxidoreductase YfjR n=1 Tax=Tetrabaena socialis TaxID=47790 RepID=A0A2J8AE80_9CHLO|nr:putative oxidoreductase YfjR [Tetrabaena socialis]|eukprot:PNH10825.1 putative oxidoreductase YfjR [Tetrabaena socialis]